MLSTFLYVICDPYLWQNASPLVELYRDHLVPREQTTALFDICWRIVPPSAPISAPCNSQAVFQSACVGNTSVLVEYEQPAFRISPLAWVLIVLAAILCVGGIIWAIGIIKFGVTHRPQRGPCDGVELSQLTSATTIANP